MNGDLYATPAATTQGHPRTPEKDRREAVGGGYLWVIPAQSAPATGRADRRAPPAFPLPPSRRPADDRDRYGYGSAWIGTYDPRTLDRLAIERHARLDRPESPWGQETVDGAGPLAVAAGEVQQSGSSPSRGNLMRSTPT
jgi:hypothetical protein